MIQLKDLKKNEKIKQKALKEEQKRMESPAEIPKLEKSKSRAKEAEESKGEVLFQRKIYPSISICNPFIV